MPDQQSTEGVAASYLIARGNTGGARNIRAKFRRGVWCDEQCSHGLAWDVPCPACDEVWRQESIKHLEKQAAKWGMRLVPIEAAGAEEPAT
jgi:hypothetical protein